MSARANKAYAVTILLLRASQFAEVALKNDAAFDLFRKDGVYPIVINDAYFDTHTTDGIYTPRPEKIQILYGGSGSGKSDFKATELLLKVLLNKYCRVIFCRKFSAQIRDSQFLKLKGLIKRYKLEPFFQIKESEMDIICLLNGNMMLSAGLDDVDKLKSVDEATDIWIEEPLDRKGSVQYTDFTELLRRLRSPLASNYIHLTFNPVTRASWIFHRLFKSDVYPSFKLKTTYTDNYFTPPGESAEYEILKKASPDEYAVYGLGEWGDPDSELSVYDGESVDDMFTNSFIQPTGVRYLTVDPALEGGDEMIIVVWDGWVIIDILVFERADGKQALNHIMRAAQTYRVPHRNICFDATGIGDYLSGFIKGAKPFKGGSAPIVPDAPKSDLQKKVSQARTFANLRAQCFFLLSDKMNNNGIYFAVKSVHLQEQTREEFTAIKRIEQKDSTKPLQVVSKLEIRQAIGRSPGLADAISMRMAFELIPHKTKAPRKVIGAGFSN